MALTEQQKQKMIEGNRKRREREKQEKYNRALHSVAATLEHTYKLKSSEQIVLLNKLIGMLVDVQEWDEGIYPEDMRAKLKVVE